MGFLHHGHPDKIGTGSFVSFPFGSKPPKASNLNYVAGQNIANCVLAKVGDDGKISVFTKARTNLIIDVSGNVPGA